MRKLEMLALTVVASALFATPVLAGAPGVPGPLIGAGIPALAGLVYLYVRARKARDK